MNSSEFFTLIAFISRLMDKSNREMEIQTRTGDDRAYLARLSSESIAAKTDIARTKFVGDKTGRARKAQLFCLRILMLH